MDINKSTITRDKKEAKTIKDGMKILAGIELAMNDTGECVGLTMGAVSLIQIVDLLCKKFGGSFKLKTAIWSANQVDINRLSVLRDNGFISECKFLMDPSVYTRKKDVVEYLHQKFTAESIVTTSTHAKFVTLESEKHSFTILSSMNFTHNPRLEQFHITSCKKTHDLFGDVVGGAFVVARDSAQKNGKRVVDKNELTKILSHSDSYDPDKIIGVDMARGEYA